MFFNGNWQLTTAADDDNDFYYHDDAYTRPEFNIVECCSDNLEVGTDNVSDGCVCNYRLTMLFFLSLLTIVLLSRYDRGAR